MDFNEWEGWYKEILETLGFLRDDDEKTAELLDKILDEKGCLTIEQFFDEIHCCWCGSFHKEAY